MLLSLVMMSLSRSLKTKWAHRLTSGEIRLDTPPAHSALTFTKVRPGFVSGYGFIWVSLERAGIDTRAVHADKLASVKVEGIQYIRIEDAIEWHERNVSSFPDHLEACRVLLFCSRGIK